MIHPPYTELIQAVNKDVEESDTPVCNSRYSIVLATSKRARQLIAGAEPMVSYSLNKPLSIAVDEVYKGKVTEWISSQDSLWEWHWLLLCSPYLLGPEVESAHFWICLGWLPLFILISGFFQKIFQNVIRRIRSIFR